MPPLRVILADDHRVFMQGLSTLIHAAGDTVIGTANDRDQLLLMILADPPDVVVVDIGMRGVGIPQLLALLRERQVATAVLVLTGNEGDFAAELIAAGAGGYMLKEHAFEDLLPAIHAVAAGKTYISPAVAGAMFSAREVRPLLTARQLQVLRLVAAGDASKRISAKLGIHVKTVDNHRRILRDKLGVHSTAELVRVAKEHNLI